MGQNRTAKTRLLRRQFAGIAISLVFAAGLLPKTPLLAAFARPCVTPTPVHPVPVHNQPSVAPPPVLIAQAPAAAENRVEKPPVQSNASSVSDRARELARLARTQIDDKDFGAAIATYQTLVGELSDARAKGEVWALIGEAFRYAGDLANSLKAMEQAVALLPSNAQIQTNLGLLYEWRNDKIHARQCYERALAIDGNNPLALNNLAYLLTETGGDLDLALAYARTAKNKMPTYMEISDTIGWIYLKKNMIGDAVTEFRIVTEAAPKNPVFHYHYAIALNKQGNQKDAAKECQAAINNNPEDALKEQIKAECAGPLPEKK